MSKEYKKRILFVGMPDMALICLSKLFADGFNIVGVIPPKINSPTFKPIFNLAKNFNLPTYTYEDSINSKDFIEKIRNLDADLGVVCSYEKKLSEDFLSVTKDGFINLHPSLLPKYRGGNPYSHVIINNEKETGITIHYMDKEFDTGNIILQYQIPVEANETMGSLFNKLNFLGADTLSEVLNYYEEYGKPDAVEQPKGNYPKAPNLVANTQDVIIDWTKSAVEIERFIRALNPFIPAITCFKGNFFKIFSSEVLSEEETNYKPGTIIENETMIAVATGKGILKLKTLQAGTYFIGDTNDFINIISPQKGDKFENE